jgi:ammonia channel protein AmtB
MAGIRDQEPNMRNHDRLIATTIAVVVWVLAGYALASGPQDRVDVRPAFLDVTATSNLPNRN